MLVLMEVLKQIYFKVFGKTIPYCAKVLSVPLIFLYFASKEPNCYFSNIHSAFLLKLAAFSLIFSSILVLHQI